MPELHELINTDYADVLQEPAFRLTIDTHQRFFLTAGNFEVHVVDDHDAYKYRFDLNGYLMAKNVPPSLHYTTMRINGMTSIREFSYPKFKALMLPSQEAFRQVVQHYRTTIGTAL